MAALPEIEAPVIMTEAEYLAFERASAFKHELVDGVVRFAHGASAAHCLITASTMASLHNQLRNRDCIVVGSLMRLLVEATRLYTYPDVIVVRGKSRLADEYCDTLLNPTVIIEVLSPSTEGHDRGRKFQDYRAIESLREYVLIAQDSPLIEQFTRQEDDTWLLSEARGLDAAIELASIACTLSLADVYEQVTFTGKIDES